MFMDFRDQPPPPRWEPRRPPPPPPRLTPRQEKIVGWLVAINVLALLIAPIGGASIIYAVVAMLR